MDYQLQKRSPRKNSTVYPPLDPQKVIKEYLGYAERLRPFVIDSSLKNQPSRKK